MSTSVDPVANEGGSGNDDELMVVHRSDGLVTVIYPPYLSMSIYIPTYPDAEMLLPMTIS